MTELTKKYNLLDKNSKRSVLDYMEYLLNKKVQSPKSRMTDYKKKILNVSVWSDADIEKNIFQWFREGHHGNNN